jgi:hypothetical protein
MPVSAGSGLGNKDLKSKKNVHLHEEISIILVDSKTLNLAF